MYSKPSSFSPRDTSRPVSIRKIPTPPMHLRRLGQSRVFRYGDLPDKDVPWEISNQAPELECAKSEEYQT